MSGHLAPALVLNRHNASLTLERLSPEDADTEELWKKVHRTWQTRGMANTVAVPLSSTELALVKDLGVTTRPRVVEYRYLAVYRHPTSGQEVRVKSETKPPKRKTLRVAGTGSRKFKRVKLYRITQSKESTQMAKTKAKNRKAKDEIDELEELEGLEELEDLEEPDDEEDDDEEEAKPTRKRRAKKTAKKAAVEEDDDEDEEDEEDEDDEEEEEPVAKKRQKKGAAKGGKKSSTKSGKGKSKGGPAAGRTTEDMTGGVGTAALAEAASEIADAEVTGRDVRVYLRREGIPKDEEHGRYVWPSAKNKAFQKLAKAIAKEFVD